MSDSLRDANLYYASIIESFTRMSDSPDQTPQATLTMSEARCSLLPIFDDIWVSQQAQGRNNVQLAAQEKLEPIPASA